MYTGGADGLRLTSIREGVVEAEGILAAKPRRSAEAPHVPGPT